MTLYHQPARQKCLVLHPYHHASQVTSRCEAVQYRLEEAVNLAQAIDLEVLYQEALPLREIRPSTYLGTGKIEALKCRPEVADAQLIIFDTSLTPVQQRNLEKAFNTKVIDRTGLILEIFGERAATQEGTLQVELASLEYQRSRLVRSWTHLERQRGGLGFIGGPGESQIELDRRLIDERIHKIKLQLDKVQKRRVLQRSNRERTPYPIVAIVGYTNAGKSTLFNYLTEEKVRAEDLLFATLDPTMRKMTLPSGTDVIVSDTVGFISELPTQLIAAFRATLEEVQSADLILHVLDLGNPQVQTHYADVIKILASLNVNEHDYRIVNVGNKIDACDPQACPYFSDLQPISARYGTGITALLEKIDKEINSNKTVIQTTLAASEGAALAWLHEYGTVVDKKIDADSGDITLSVALSRKHLAHFLRKFPQANCKMP